MAVTIRMTRRGRKKQPVYRIVAADDKSSRDGKFLEIVGTYDPSTKATTIKQESAEKWIKNGATLSRTVKEIFVKNGVSLATK